MLSGTVEYIQSSAGAIWDEIMEEQDKFDVQAAVLLHRFRPSSPLSPD